MKAGKLVLQHSSSQTGVVETQTSKVDEDPSRQLTLATSTSEDRILTIDSETMSL